MGQIGELRDDDRNPAFECTVRELSPYNCVKREIEKEPCCFPFGRINSGPKTPNIRRNAKPWLNIILP